MADPSMPVGDIPLVTPLASSLLPSPTSNQHWASWPGSITDIFYDHARNSPERPCVVESLEYPESSVTEAPSRSFSYEQIRRAASRVSASLRSNGIVPEDVVVVYAYRGVDLVVAILGVLMAGATFSVIDPAYPPARQQVYLSVAKPRALILLDKAGALDSTVRHYIQEELQVIFEIPALAIQEDGSVFGGASQTTPSQDVLAPYSGDLEDELSKPVPVGIDSVGTLSFTSGSTGIPKGVQGRHYSLTHFFPWMAQEFHLDSSSRFTMLSGIAHDPIQRDIFTPLFLGAHLRIPTALDIASPGRLSGWMSTHGISVTHLTPAMGQLLAATATIPIPTLRHAFFVGDILTKRDCQRLQQLAPNCRIVNMYGTTETQRAVSYLTIPSRAEDPSYLSSSKEVIPAGRGMQDVQLLVVNRRPGRGLCGVGEVGEIYVRSGGLAEGYLCLEEVTAAKFLTNWFGTSEVSDEEKKEEARALTQGKYKGRRDRLYRTGDLGRYRPDGQVECTGRADDQVKIRGFRIELGEIDTHLSQHPLVRENVTLVRRDKNEEPTLVSYFVPMSRKDREMKRQAMGGAGSINREMEESSGMSSMDESTHSIPSSSSSEAQGQPRQYRRLIRDIREHLKRKLPSYSVPTLLVPLRKMPLTPNGKIDKPSLPFPDTVIATVEAEEGASGKATATSNFTSTEKEVLAVWVELLGPRVDGQVDEAFFDVGGHSVLATRLVFELRQRCSVDLPLGLVFQEPTVRGMAREVDRLRMGGMLIQDTGDEEKSSPSGGKAGGKGDVSTTTMEEDKYAEDLPGLEQDLTQTHQRALSGTKDLTTTTTGNVIFLTGATGFLGAFILHDLLTRFPAKETRVICLVRAKSETLGMERLRRTAEAHLLYDPSLWEGRVEVMVGDLGSPHFALEEAAWTRLVQEVNVIIHNGALVHWVFPYAKLRGPNVLGTVEALKLALLSTRSASFHFVSSTSVLDTDDYLRISEASREAGGGGVPEEDDLEGSRLGLRSGYGQSKWVSERLVMWVVKDKGWLRGSILRPGYVVGHSGSGVSNADDFIWRLVKGCVQLGEVPSMHNVVNMCPVDYVSGVVVGVALAFTTPPPESPQKPTDLPLVYHITNPHRFRFSDLFGQLSRYGWEVKEKEYISWRKHLMDVTLSSVKEAGEKEKEEGNALYPLLHFVLDDLPTSTRSPELDDRHTREVVVEGPLGIQCPRMQEGLIGLYLAYLVQVGFLSPPTDTQGEALPLVDQSVSVMISRNH